MRNDVLAFAQQMSEIMDEKQKEREASGLALYTDKSTQLNDVFDEFDSSVENFQYSVSDNSEEEINKAQRQLTHIANYCMIISTMLKADRKFNEEEPETNNAGTVSS